MSSETDFEGTNVEKLYDMVRVVNPKQTTSKKTVTEVFDEFTDEQKLVVNFLIAEAIKEARDSDIIKKQ